LVIFAAIFMPQQPPAFFILLMILTVYRKEAIRAFNA